MAEVFCIDLLQALVEAGRSGKFVLSEAELGMAKENKRFNRDGVELV